MTARLHTGQQPAPDRNQVGAVSLRSDQSHHPETVSSALAYKSDAKGMPF